MGLKIVKNNKKFVIEIPSIFLNKSTNDILDWNKTHPNKIFNIFNIETYGTKVIFVLRVSNKYINAEKNLIENFYWVNKYTVGDI